MRQKVLFISSSGGHWIQLTRLLPAALKHEVFVATTSVDAKTSMRDGVVARFYTVPDASLSDKLKLVWCAARVLVVVALVRPDVVISTGAAPGYFGIIFGRLFGSRTVWVDSVANATRLSVSGKHAGRWCDLWVTQWPELAREAGPVYLGSLL